MRYLIRISYNGDAFCGWQVQTNASSVQGCLQKALSILLNEETAVTGTGRTDTKVNAINYVAHFDARPLTGPELDMIRYKLNAILPAGIVVHGISEAAGDFHARFDASEREYKYFLHRKKDPFMISHSYLYTFPLDVDNMNKACGYLLGTHDFSCFEKTGGNNKTSICTIAHAHWSNYLPDHVKNMGYPGKMEDYLVFTISADRFLRNMVRAVVGTMLEIGRGKHDPGWINDLIETGTRSDAGQSVPGHPLFLERVDFFQK